MFSFKVKVFDYQVLCLKSCSAISVFTSPILFESGDSKYVWKFCALNFQIVAVSRP